jgi:molybdate-binding protein
VAAGHVDAARAAAALRCVALTTEGAARMAGLEFVALEAHTVQIWVDSRWRSHPGFEALGELLGAREFAAAVTRFGGYDLAGCGEVVGQATA